MGHSVYGLKNYRFERGDIASVFMAQACKQPGIVNKGDTVGIIKSHFLENEILRLENLKMVEIANRDMESTGEKEEIKRQAEQQVQIALEQLELERKNYSRQKILFEDSIISQAEFDLAENTYRLAEINHQVARTALDALVTGSKPAVINLVNERIAGYEREIRKMKSLKDEYFLVSPLTGALQFSHVTPDIFSVSDTSGLIVKCMIHPKYIPFLKEVTGIEVEIQGNGQAVPAVWIGEEESITLVDGSNPLIVRAMLPNHPEGWHSGMHVTCTIICQKISIFEYFKRNITAG
ncbi:MAG: hypothetical protein JW861_00200 [Bacteroidales bacterium]|nr:hypothetical protein [Bacteroidales bacterium]